MKKKEKEKEEIDFKTLYEEIEFLAAQMEKPELSLDESMRIFSLANEKIKKAEDFLNKMESEIIEVGG